MTEINLISSLYLNIESKVHTMTEYVLCVLLIVNKMGVIFYYIVVHT